MSNDSLQRQFAKDILGPIFLAYCHRLWLFQMGTNNEATVALFAARGGLRLLALYERFLAVQGISPVVPCHPFMISRLAAAKGSYRRAPEVVRRQVVRIFRTETIDTLANALIPANADPSIRLTLSGLSPDFVAAPVTMASFDALMNSPSEYGLWLRRHLEEQGDLLRGYLIEMAGGSRRILLCDTGLYGCTQAILSAANSDFDWTGVYFGKSNYTGEFAQHHLRAFGLVFDSDRPSPFVPATALLRYWHLCEMPMEPPVPSVAYYYRGEAGQTLSNLDAKSSKTMIEKPGNPYYDGICDFFEMPGGPWSTQEINRNFMSAARQLQRRIYLPSTNDVQAMTVGTRNPDFGRQGEVPTLVAVPPTTTISRKVELVRDALWQEGQTRLAFPTVGGLLNMARWTLRLTAAVVRLPLTVFGR